MRRFSKLLIVFTPFMVFHKKRIQIAFVIICIITQVVHDVNRTRGFVRVLLCEPMNPPRAYYFHPDFSHLLLTNSDKRAIISLAMGICVTAARQTLTLFEGVQIPHPQPKQKTDPTDRSFVLPGMRMDLNGRVLNDAPVGRQTPT